MNQIFQMSINDCRITAWTHRLDSWNTCPAEALPHLHCYYITYFSTVNTRVLKKEVIFFFWFVVNLSLCEFQVEYGMKWERGIIHPYFFWLFKAVNCNIPIWERASKGLQERLLKRNYFRYRMNGKHKAPPAEWYFHRIHPNTLR